MYRIIGRGNKSVYVLTVTVTAVAFDFGGVLTYTSFGGLAAYGDELGLPPDALVGYFRDDPQMARLEIGEISGREFFKYVCVEAEQRHGRRLDIRRLGAAASEGERLDPLMLDLVEEVRARAAVALVTNNVAGAGWRGTFRFELFDVVLDSSALGVRKPDPQIYTALCEQLDRKPDEVAFVDDLARNTDAAAALGLHPILFTDRASCRAELVRLGVLSG
jgi:epoxide hydrolase-like predicted phosphatase